MKNAIIDVGNPVGKKLHCGGQLWRGSMTPIFVVFGLAVIGFVAVVILWNRMLDNSKLETIRFAMLSGLTAVFVVEGLIHVTGLTKSFFLPYCVLCNTYAYLDAIVRFPSVPGLESYFAIKLIASVIGKTVVYAIGLSSSGNWGAWLLATLFLNVWLLPVMYVMALPFGDSSPFRKDRDMAVEVFLILADSKERNDKIHTLRVSFQNFRKLLGFSRTVSLSPRKGSLPVSLGTPMRTELSLNDKAYI